MDVDQQIADIKYKMNSFLAQEEIFWKQRSKIFWLQTSDANTKTFRSYASSKKRKNTIMQLSDDQGRVHSWGHGLSELILSYFEDLFSSRGCVDHHFTQLVHCRITADQSQSLSQPFEELEILKA